MELAFTGCGPLNAVVASKNDEISYSIRTAYSLSKMSTTIFHTRDGGRVALIEWPAFGPNLLTLGEERVSPSSSSSSSSIRVGISPLKGSSASTRTPYSSRR
ncbi:hypothetical protein EXIGLDRAFT_727255 [Exidia glandulosa HHB12029]|uniref:Uncharacterized protein n=1 Tax=Exidia glandulosa HHB12029 TaxID=1314781 RepID=A0A165DF53_EXIGL|nr:hypothetical protein EXIGLDRAFT_727255 [Exidia glandulosa HHB12029]